MTAMLFRRGAGVRGASRAAIRTPPWTRWRGALLPLLALAALLPAVQLGAMTLRSIADMPIRQVQLRGEFEHLDATQLEARIAPWLDSGFFRIDLQAVQRELEALPWVHVVTVQRRFPDQLSVRVTEQVPLLRWGEHALLNPYGEPFRPASTAAFDSLPLLRGPEGSEQIMLARFDALMEVLAPSGHVVDELVLDGKHSWSLRLDNGLQAMLGRHQLELRSRRLAALLGRPQLIATAPGSTVDLRYSNGFALSPAAVGPDASLRESG